MAVAVWAAACVEVHLRGAQRRGGRLGVGRLVAVRLGFTLLTRETERGNSSRSTTSRASLPRCTWGVTFRRAKSPVGVEGGGLNRQEWPRVVTRFRFSCPFSCDVPSAFP